MITIAIEGASRVGQRLAAVQGQAPEILAGVLFRSGEEIMTAAKHLTPVDTGALRASGHVLPPVLNLRDVVVELGFGGVAGSGNHGGQSNALTVGYALVVHENLAARHPVGQAKYLEVPVRAAVQTIVQQAAAAMSLAFAQSSATFAKWKAETFGRGRLGQSVTYGLG